MLQTATRPTRKIETASCRQHQEKCKTKTKRNCVAHAQQGRRVQRPTTLEEEHRGKNLNTKSISTVCTTATPLEATRSPAAYHVCHAGFLEGALAGQPKPLLPRGTLVFSSRGLAAPVSFPEVPSSLSDRGEGWVGAAAGKQCLTRTWSETIVGTQLPLHSPHVLQGHAFVRSSPLPVWLSLWRTPRVALFSRIDAERDGSNNSELDHNKISNSKKASWLASQSANFRLLWDETSTAWHGNDGIVLVHVQCRSNTLDTSVITHEPWVT